MLHNKRCEMAQTKIVFVFLTNDLPGVEFTKGLSVQYLRFCYWLLLKRCRKIKQTQTWSGFLPSGQHSGMSQTAAL